MSEITYDFEDGSLAAFGVGASSPANAPGIDNPVASDVFGAPSTQALVLPASAPNTYSQAYIDVQVVAGATIEFDYAVEGSSDPADTFTFGAASFDDGSEVVGLQQTGNTAWSHLAPFSLPTGHLRLVFIYSRGSGDPQPANRAWLDNIHITGLDTGDGGGGTPTGYLRGDWLKHLGGVYIARVDGPTSEPGPGDSADWFEVVARPVAYTPDPRDIPVRAATTNPFDADETGLWLVLDGDGNVTGQTYVTPGA